MQFVSNLHAMSSQYAYQQELDMVPLMMETNYSPNGWLGLMLGMYIATHPLTSDSELMP